MNSPCAKRRLSAPEQTAIDWHSRQQSGDAGAQAWVEFTDWLNADAAHNTAYTMVSDIWDKAGRFGAAFSSPQVQESPAVSAKIFRFPGAKKATASVDRPLVLAGGFGSAIAASLMIMASPMVLGQSQIAYSTDIGEQRTVTLADGSTIMLNTNTHLTVKYGRKERHIDMQSGEAFFSVEHNETKPFTVAVHGLLVKDVGTRFDVRDDALQTIVSVTEGIVDVGLVPNARGTKAGWGQQAQRLNAGQQITFTDAKKSVVHTFNAEEVTAWKQGQLVFHNDDLEKVTAELNRYLKTPVQLADASLSGMHFTGVLQIHDQKRAVRDLAAFFALAPEYKPGRIVLKQEAKSIGQ
jgi:transmembrane sensor